MTVSKAGILVHVGGNIFKALCLATGPNYQLLLFLAVINSNHRHGPHGS